MNPRIKVTLIALFCALYGTAQNSDTKEIKAIQPANNYGTVIIASSGSAEKSPYFGFDNRIKEICVGETIPDKFPTREGYADKESYRRIANEWLKAHSAFVKPEFIHSLIEK